MVLSQYKNRLHCLSAFLSLSGGNWQGREQGMLFDSDEPDLNRAKRWHIGQVLLHGRVLVSCPKSQEEPSLLKTEFYNVLVLMEFSHMHGLADTEQHD